MRVIRRILSVASSGFRPPSLAAFRRSFCNSSNPLLSKLLQTPNSQIKSTLDSLHFSPETSLSCLDSLVTALRSSSRDKARLVLEWRLDRMLKDNEIDHHQYSNLISLCAKIQNVSLAIRIFASMENIGIQPTTDVFNSLIHVCLSSPSDVITALSLFEIMEISQAYKPNSQTYDTFIFGFSSLRDADKVQAWFAAKIAAGFSANLQNYESIISACVRMKAFDAADRFYNEMMSMGIVPSVVILEYVLEGLCKHRNCKGVGEFLKFLLECGFEINGNMIEKVVELYSQHGKVDEMEELLESLMELDKKSEALLPMHSGIIRLYARLDRLDDIENSVGRMMSRGMCFRSPDDVDKVISSYFRKEAYDRLDLFLKHIKGSHKLTRSTYDLLVAGYRRAGLAEKLDLVIKDMKLAGLF